MSEGTVGREFVSAGTGAGGCRICTGCGRCQGGNGPIRIVTDFHVPGLWNWESRTASGSLAAVDIGTTTIAMVLYDGKGEVLDRFMTVNPQVRYGADVLSRIQAACKEEAARDMREAVMRVLEEGILRFQRTVTVKGHEKLRLAVIAGNTTMLYLLQGFAPQELGQAPFRASRLEMAKDSLAGVPSVILPGLSAFVGADIVAGIHACKMAERDEVTLLVDLGTNGEMAIGNRERITACATAAGPAFEGGATRGIWGADMIHLTSLLLQEGILDETGLLQEEYFEEGILVGAVHITQQAVRGLQLAKGAVAAGISLLAREHGLKSLDEIEQVILAGGFGYHLSAQDAARVGLLPGGLVPRVMAGGNTALAGALRFGLALMQDQEDIRSGGVRALEEIRVKTRIINLAELKNFEERYLESLNLIKW